MNQSRGGLVRMLELMALCAGRRENALEMLGFGPNECGFRILASASRGSTVGPASLRLPTLAIVNAADEAAPLASVRPFIEEMPVGDVRIIEYAGETGVGLQHLGILAGRDAYARVWPQIIAWLNARE